MKRVMIIALLGVLLCVGASVTVDQAFAQAVPTAPPAATSSVPTSTPAAPNSKALPNGTLILLQKNQAIALPPNKQPIALKPEQFGAQASGDYRFGVRYTHATADPNSPSNLLFVDNTSGQTKPIPGGTNLGAPGVTWKRDGSGVAVFDQQPAPNAPNAGAILYYDVASGQSQVLIAPPAPNQTATPIGWSPSGRYLIYVAGGAGVEGAGAPSLKVFLYDATTKQSTALPADATGFVAWDRASTGFFAQKGDIASGTSGFVYFGIAAPTTPKALTPAKTLDFLIDVSPDNKQIVVSSSATGTGAAAVNLYTMNFDGSNRAAITTLKITDQSITALVWGADGIYYSLSGKSDSTTWRIGADGKNAQQIAVGTLLAIVGN